LARDGEEVLRDDDLLETIERCGERVALVMIGGVNFLTGQRFDLKEITRVGHAAGCVVGFDLAHAAGNVPLELHDWDADFAAWCNYKYLNAGPGAVGGCFVHEKHHREVLPRFGGWWGNDPATRFKMQLIPDFQPVASADAWQLSNPPVLALAPLEASLELFDQAGMAALRKKSVKLTGFLEELLQAIPGAPISITTPTEPERRGCQLSLRVGPRAREIQAALEAGGVVTDFREPDVIRVAPAPLYNSFNDIARFVSALCVGLGVSPDAP
jgi:kynureninase